MHQTRSLGVLIPYFIHNMVFVNYTYDMVVSTQFHKFYGRSFVRVLYLILMKDIGRWLPWMLPGSTGRFPVSSTPAVVRCAAGVGGAVWVDEHRVIHHSHTASKLCSPDGYRLGTTPPQYCIKPTQQNRVVLALQILPTCPLKNYVILVLKQSTGTSLSLNVLSKQYQCPLELMSSTITCSLFKLKQNQVKWTLTAIIFTQRKQLIPPTQISHFHAPSNPFRRKSDFGKGRCSHS